MQLILDGPFRGLVRNGYGVILADPPWNLKCGINSRHASTKYSTMSTEEIKFLPLDHLAARDCWLFLWTTPPFLQHAFAVAEAWGFRYSSIGFTWVKLNPSGVGYARGTGFTTIKNTEPCLLFKRGAPPRSAVVEELVVARRRTHSRKPDEVSERIELFAGDVRRVELFARQARRGWSSWGDQVGKWEMSHADRAASHRDADRVRGERGRGRGDDPREAADHR